MTDHEMTLAELNLAISEVRGYTVKKHYSGDPHGYHWGLMACYDPEGHICGSTPSEEITWMVHAPKWATDANTALELLAEICDSVSCGEHIYAVGRQPCDKTWIVARTGTPYDDFEEAPTAAEAIARAWWAWKA